MDIIVRNTIFEDFDRRNARQIKLKSRYFGVLVDEIRSALFIIFAEKYGEYDAEKGSLEAFLFSRLHAVLSAYKRDVCSYAKTLDDSSESGLAFRMVTEYWISTQSSEPCFSNTNGIRLAAGTSTLRSLADAVSGKSSRQMATELKIGRRRINQILKHRRDESVFQYYFDF